MIYNEQAARKNHSVQGKKIPLTLSCEDLPEGADFDEKGGIFTWTPSEAQTGEYLIHFTADDGILPESMELKIYVGTGYAFSISPQSQLLPSNAAHCSRPA